MPKPIRCILLIDDDPDDNFLHRMVIEESDLCEEVRVAENGPEALRYLTQPDDAYYLRPDLIFLDINMPGMNGFEFLEEYEKLPPELKSSLVVLMLTTSLNPVDKDKATRFQAVGGYHGKPLTQAMLDEVVTRYFQ
ncbi:response regulator [Nibrella saemangeumensis]|uniref:Response regulator n=1 Tax=Nibrella saemangeumensis TaxID=1084526 RepID=A0ABP8N0L5_9BACT